MDELISFVGDALAVVMCFELLRKGYWRCAFAFVFIQCTQLLEIPTLKLMHAFAPYPTYWETWHLFDKANIPLEIAAAFSISRKRCAISFVAWLMILHVCIKELHYLPVEVSRDLPKNGVYYARVLVNILIEIAVLATVIIRPAVLPLKERQCQKKRSIPRSLLTRIQRLLRSRPPTLQTLFHRHPSR